MASPVLRRFSVFAVLVGSAVFACQVPVFRYALERWPADNFEVLVLHSGELSGPAELQLKSLQESTDLPANFDLRAVDLSRGADDLLKSAWKQSSRDNEAVVAVLYPRTAGEVPDRLVGVMPFSDQAIANIVDSPVRQSVTEKLIEGDSAVWIFVPCGDAKQDDVALAMLKREVQQNQKQLKLPDDVEADEAFNAENEIELRIGFSIVTLDRSDPKEKFLLQMLLASEPDLEELNQPMAFPVLGRGRVLYALVGPGIAPETIGIASRFIVGPCSCQVKEQNPGFDLLLSFDWDEKIAGSTLSDPIPKAPEKPVLLKIPPGRKKK